MAMQWFTPRAPNTPWVSRSADGYYTVGMPVMGMYGAYHVPMVWATPEQIGEAPELSLAQELCEQHRAKPRA